MPNPRRSSDLLKKGLKISHLRVIAALAETGQISVAASRLGMTQPAASRLLAEAEGITGHAIHQRAGRGIALTPEGIAFARRASRVLAEITDAGREMAEIADGAQGHVMLGSVTGPALDRVLPALRAARLSLPQMTAQVEVATSDVLGDQLLSGRLDFTLSRLPSNRDPDLFDIRMIGPEPVSLVVRRDHRLADRIDLQPDDLMEFDWVLPGPGAILRDAVIDRLRALGLPEPPGRLSTSSFLLTLAMLQQSNAIAPLASSVAGLFAAGSEGLYAILPIDLGISVAPFGLVTRAGSTLTPAAQRIKALILRESD